MPPRPRQTHAGKSPREIQDYGKNYIQPNVSQPTAPQARRIDSTEDKAPDLSTGTTTTNTRSPSSGGIRKAFHDYGLIGALVGALILLVIALIGYVNPLMKEVGELKGTLDALKEIERRDRSDLEKIEQHFHEDLERLRDRKTPPSDEKPVPRKR